MIQIPFVVVNVHYLINGLQNCINHDVGVLFYFFYFCLLMLLVRYDLLVWHFLISVNILNNRNITSRSMGLLPVLPAPVAQLVECQLQGIGGDMGSIPAHDIPKLLKWYSLGTRTGRLGIRIM